MQMRVLAILTLACLGMAPSATLAAAPHAAAPKTSSPAATMPKIPSTPTEIQAAVDHGEYPQALTGIARLLDPKHALDYDRQAMLMLRVECELQLKHNIPALDMLDGIRKQAHENASKKDEAQATALGFLIRKSPGYLYTPKTAADKTPIPILDRMVRPKAYQSLFDDELAVAQQMAKEAAFGTTLAPITKVCDELYNVQAAELVATGSIDKSKQTATQVVDSSRLIIGKGESAYETEVTQILANADRIVTTQRGVTMVNGRARPDMVRTRNGLTGIERQRLAAIMTDCDGICALIERIRFLADNPKALPVVFTRAEQLKGRAQGVLDKG